MRLLRWLRYHLQTPPRRQTCKDCWRNDGLDFHVADFLWQAVTGSTSGGVLCLECFDRRAEAKGIDYSGAIAVMGRRAWLANGVAAERLRSIRRLWAEAEAG